MFAITVLFFLVIGYSLLITIDFKMFLVGCGMYAAFILIYSIICWAQVPKHLRRASSIPSDFKSLRLGEVSESISRLIDEGKIERDECIGSHHHQLYGLERQFTEGIWRCEIEVCDDRVLAYATRFESVASPVLDRWKQVGEGQFLAVPG